MSAFHGQQLIGAATSAAGSVMFRAWAPGEGVELAGVFHEATTAEVDRAAQLAARDARDYRQRPAEARAAFLERIAAEIEGLGEPLLERARQESGLPASSFPGEVQRTAGQLRLFASVVREGSWVEARIDRAIRDRKPPRPDIRRMLIPLGPVAVFGASNFPLAFSVAGGDTASALAAGCPVIVKAHPSHPGTCELVGTAVRRAVEACGMPEGAFSMVHGPSPRVGLDLVTHPLVTAVGFTGSLRGGRALFDAAAARPRPIPVYAEMGSTNPIFVLPGVLEDQPERFANGLVRSMTVGTGQFCTNPGMVVGRLGEGFNRLKAKLGELVAAVPPATMLGRGILEAYEAGIARLTAAEGVRVVGRSNAEADRARTEAGAVAVAADAATFLRHRELGEEVFGPSTLLVACGTAGEMEQVACALDGHLTATLYGTEADVAAHAELVAILETKVGRLIVNGFPTGVEVCAAMQHGGPYPATTDSRTTSVGTAAIQRFARPICYQSFPHDSLPVELRNGNPRGIWRLVDDRLTQDAC